MREIDLCTNAKPVILGEYLANRIKKLTKLRDSQQCSFNIKEIQNKINVLRNYSRAWINDADTTTEDINPDNCGSTQVFQTYP